MFDSNAFKMFFFKMLVYVTNGCDFCFENSIKGKSISLKSEEMDLLQNQNLIPLQSVRWETRREAHSREITLPKKSSKGTGEYY